MSPPPRRATLAAAGFGATVAILGLASYALRPAAGLGSSDAAQFLGRFHTLALHLPIGALLLLAVVESLTLVPRLRARVEPLTDLVLAFLAATSAVAFLLGVLLASGGGYPSRLLVLHRTLTLIGLAFVAACTLFRVRAQKVAYRVSLLLAVTTMSIGAHYGGSMTHGDGFLVQFAPAAIRHLAGVEDKPAPVVQAPAAPNEDPRVFADILLPLFEHKCVECHGDKKVKGALRLDSFAAVMKGGEHKATVVPGHGDKSDLYARMKLPESSDDHMPPDGKPGLSPAEIELVRFWIDRGATETMHASDGIVPDDVSRLLREHAGGAATHASTGEPGQPATTGTTGTTGTKNEPAPSTTAASNKVQSAPVEAASPSAPGAERLAFHDDVAPLLAARCASCHGGTKQKGALRLDSFAALTAGGKSGGGARTLLERVNRPIADSKHMPPDDQPQLTPTETALLAFWVGHGASDTMKESELPAGLRGHRVAAVAAARGASGNAGANAGANASANASAEADAGAKASAGANAGAEAREPTVDLWGDVVQGLLQRRCAKCHTGENAEGGLRVEDVPRMISESDVVPGKPDESALYKRMIRPATDKAHMPPPKEPQATADELAMIRAWIEEGARASSPIARSRVPSSLLAAQASEPAAAAPAGAVTPLSAAAALKVPPSAGGCGTCAVGRASTGGLTGSHDALVVALTSLALGLLLRRRTTSMRRRRARAT